MAFLLCLCALWACKEQKTTNQMANCCHQINIENSQKYNPIDSAIKHVQVIPLQTDSIALIENPDIHHDTVANMVDSGCIERLFQNGTVWFDARAQQVRFK